MRLARRVRGVVGMTAIWTVGWVLAMLPLRVWDSLDLPASQRLGHFLHGVGYSARWGALSGLSFALLMLLAERSGSLQDLRGWRLALWGTLAALVLPAILLVLAPANYPLSEPTPGMLLEALVWSAAFGGGSSIGILRVARGAAADRLADGDRDAPLPSVPLPPAT